MYQHFGARTECKMNYSVLLDYIDFVSLGLALGAFSFLVGAAFKGLYTIFKKFF